MKYVFILTLLIVGAAAGLWGTAIVIRWNDNMTHTLRIMPGERSFPMPAGVVPRGGEMVIPKEQRDVAAKKPNPVKMLTVVCGAKLGFHTSMCADPSLPPVVFTQQSPL